MVIRYLDMGRPLCVVGSFKTDAPLPVDPDAELPSPVAAESFETVAAQHPKVIQRSCRIQYGQSFSGLLFESLKLSNELAGGEGCCFFVSIVSNHMQTNYSN